MPILTLTLQTLTPLITKGAANDARNDPAELRAASFRGMFRYWLRALLGARVQNDIDRLREYESHIFGSVERGSAVSIRVSGSPLDTRNNQVLPTWLKLRAIPHGERFDLIIQSHPLGEIPDRALAAVLLALRLGGLGLRARRGGGSLRVRKAVYDPEGSTRPKPELVEYFQRLVPRDQQSLVGDLRGCLIAARQTVSDLTTSTPFTGLPTYPVLHSKYATVLVGPACQDYQSALAVVWKAMQNVRKDLTIEQREVFGYTKKRLRFASPVHMRVALSGELRDQKGNPAAYHPVITIFYTDPRHPDTGQSLIHDWSPMQQFIKECTSQHNFVLVKFGGGSKP